MSQWKGSYSLYLIWRFTQHMICQFASITKEALARHNLLTKLSCSYWSDCVHYIYNLLIHAIEMWTNQEIFQTNIYKTKSWDEKYVIWFHMSKVLNCHQVWTHNSYFEAICWEPLDGQYLHWPLSASWKGSTSLWSWLPWLHNSSKADSFSPAPSQRSNLWITLDYSMNLLDKSLIQTPS